MKGLEAGVEQPEGYSSIMVPLSYSNRYTTDTKKDPCEVLQK